ncbi:MAG: hypothetical protein Satyrvirus40_8, partial [Satyrvirus sp.]
TVDAYPFHNSKNRDQLPKSKTVDFPRGTFDIHKLARK